MGSLWIAASALGEVPALADVLEDGLGRASVLAVGPQALADEARLGTAGVSWIDTAGGIADAYAAAVADALVQEAPDIVVGYGTPAVRAALGQVAARMGAHVVSNVVSVSLGADSAVVEHKILDDQVIETLDVSLPACLLLDAATFEPVEPDPGAAPAPVVRLDAEPAAFAELLEVRDLPTTGLEDADRVVGVGRGVDNGGSFELAKSLAAALGAELSGSRPGVRDFGYFDESANYIGVTGARLKARLYVALGVSGTAVHRAGLANVQKVVCINKDEKAQFFDYADYGIVGCVEDVVPELVRQLAR